jgi:trehalose utilization protein
MPIRVTVWSEFRHEKKHESVKKIYPTGIHTVLAEAIAQHLGADAHVRTATLDEPDHGLTDDILNTTDVMLWWGHMAHHEVKDDIAAKVAARVRNGMGLVVLHSGHYAKPFKLLMGTACHLKWREAGEKERLWVVAPGHPITAGLKKDYIEIPHEEMYGEHFDIPTPEELIFLSWFEGGEVFRSGCVWRRGAGRIFYFRPGHETFPTYFHPEVRLVIANGVRYTAPVAAVQPYRDGSPNINPPLSPIVGEHVVDEAVHKK